jgi:Family of unknown function (DUF6491)
MRSIFSSLLALPILLAACGAPNEPPTEPVPGARINFYRLSIDDWKAEDSTALLIRTLDRHYYRATLMGPCPDLPWATRIGFDSRGTQELDRFSAIIVEGRRCPFSELTEIPPVEGW